MITAFVLRCDGRRDFIEQTVESVQAHVKHQFSYGVIVNDSGDPDYAKWLDETFPYLERLHHSERQGLGACFKSALEVVAGTDSEWAFFVEDDTPLLRDVSLAAMADVLNANPQLSQLMLQRPAFNAEEKAAGGVYQLTPDAFTECTDGTHYWVRHDKWFGFQPSLIPRRVVALMLAKSENYLELGVTEPLKAAGYHFGYWGKLDDAPYCDHTGVIRSTGYHW